MPTDKQRREAQRRKLQRQAARRRQRALTRRRNSIIATVVGVLVVVAVVVFVIVQTGDDDSSPAAKSPSATPTASASPSASSSAKPVAAYPCDWKKSTAPASRKVEVPPTTTPSKTGTVAMSVDTNRGAMTFTLDRAEAPCAVESFLSLATQKYFDKTPCPRVTTDSGLFVLQCGDPTGTGAGGPGYTFADELTGKEQYTSGVLAMANGGANTNGSQFFIVYKVSELPAKYTIFGKVTKGLDVVTKVAAGGDDGSNSAGGGKPKLPITLTKVSEAA